MWIIHLDVPGAEHKYQQEQAKERMAAKKAASDIMKERQQAATYQKQAHSYKSDLAKVQQCVTSVQGCCSVCCRVL